MGSGALRAKNGAGTARCSLCSLLITHKTPRLPMPDFCESARKSDTQRHGGTKLWLLFIINRRKCFNNVFCGKLFDLIMPWDSCFYFGNRLFVHIMFFPMTDKYCTHLVEYVK